MSVGSIIACRTKIKCRDIVEAQVFAYEWSVGNSTKEKYQIQWRRAFSRTDGKCKRKFCSQPLYH